MDWSIRITDVVMVLATLVSPFLAVQASERLRANVAAKEAREKIFHTLIATRGARMTPDHVAALNRIDLTFPPESFSGVSDAWNLYMRHLSQPEPTDPAARVALATAGNVLFLGMLRAMASALKIPFSDSALRHNAYYPMGYVHNESQHYALRDAALKVLQGEQGIVIKPEPNHPKAG